MPIRQPLIREVISMIPIFSSWQMKTPGQLPQALLSMFWFFG